MTNIVFPATIGAASWPRSPQGKGPGDLQLLDVLSIDLIESAVAKPGEVLPAIGQSPS